MPAEDRNGSEHRDDESDPDESDEDDKDDWQGCSCVTNESDYVTKYNEALETQVNELKKVLANGKNTNLQKSNSGMNTESHTKAKDPIAELLRRLKSSFDNPNDHLKFRIPELCL